MPNKKMRKGAAETTGLTRAGTVARSVGARLRELRVERSMSQGDIEHQTGLLRCYVSRVEGGYTVPSVETLEKFAAALAVPLHALFTRGTAAGLNSLSKMRQAKAAPPDPFSDKVHRFTARMSDRERETFLSMLRKLVVLDA